MIRKTCTELPLGLLATLPSNRAGWAELGPQTTIDLPSPRFLGGAGTAQGLLPHFAGRQGVLPAFGCAVLTNAYAYGDGLAIIDDYLLMEPSLTASAIDIGAWGFFANVGALQEGKRTIENWSEHPRPLEEAVLLSRRSDFVYGHWLLETLPRVKLAAKLCSARATFIVNAHISEYQIEMLEQLGVGRERLFQLDAGVSVRCERLIVPSLAHWSANVVSRFALETYDALIDACLRRHPATPDQSGRILVTRASRAHDPRPLHNVAGVEAVVKRHGYGIVDPGGLHWSEQIARFARAGSIVGLSGSGLHNTVYSGSSAHVLVLQPNQSSNFLQTAIAGIREHSVSYLFGESFSSFNRHGSETGYVIDLELLDHVLATVLP